MVCELLLEVSGCHYVKLVTEGLAPQKPPCDCFARHNFFYFMGEQIVCLVCDPHFAQLRYCSVNIYRQADVFHENQKLKLHSELMTNGTQKKHFNLPCLKHIYLYIITLQSSSLELGLDLDLCWILHGRLCLRIYHMHLPQLIQA